MNTTIHPTAIIDPRAELADGVCIGAYSIIKGAARIGVGTIVQEHAHIQGNTVIGANCRIFPGAYVGLPPQHLKADPEAGWLVVGDGVIIRETATLHRATNSGIERATRVGDRCFLMAGAHVAHDAVVENDVILANMVLLGGHCRIGRNAFIGGGAGIHQFVRIGRLSILAGSEGVSQDVPPFAAVRYGGRKGYNAVGCRRSGMSRAAIQSIRAAYHCLHKHRVLSDATAAIRSEVADTAEVRELLEFIATSKRGVLPAWGSRKRRDRDVDAEIRVEEI
jgi:UDP-N-acetylglucosamine acyltransferase